MCQAVPIQVLHIIVGGMVVKVVIDKSEKETIDVAIFSKYGRVCVVWKELVNTIHQRRSYWVLWVCFFKCFYKLCISLVGFQNHITRTTGATCFKIQH